MLWAVICILLALVLVAIFIFGDSPSVRGSWVQKSRQRMMQANSFLLHKLSRIDHPSLKWMVPIFYLSVLTFCFHQFLTKSWSVLPSSIKTSGFHQISVFLSIVTIYTLTFICIFSDPGYIDKFNVAEVQRIFHNNEIIFFSNNPCTTCEFVKPARSKHCSTCGRCVMLFDHHCVWINNCVGYYNYRYFIGWLMSNLQFMCYGNYLLCQAVPPLQMMHYVKINDAYKVSVMFILLCSIFSLIVVIFTALQFRYIYLGVTTNEVDKWSDIEYLVRIGTLVQRQGQGQYFEVVDHQLINLQNTEVHPLYPDITRVASVEEIDNIYDKGFYHNLIEKFFPTRVG